MSFVDQILYWENKKRVAELYEFRKHLITYFDNTEMHPYAGGRSENQKAGNERVMLNRSIDRVGQIIRYAYIAPEVTVTGSSFQSSYKARVDVITNLFNLHHYEITPSTTLDFIDRAIGIYEKNQGASIKRTVNPFYYLNLLIEWVLNAPFFLIGKFGVNEQSAKQSKIGKFVHGILYLITVVAALLTIVEILGYTEDLKVYFFEVFGSR